MLTSYRPPRPLSEVTDAQNIARVRADFLSRRPRNLEFLLRGRYAWMNPYLEGKQAVVDLGAGMGLSREFIDNPNLRLTDIEPHPWLDQQVDARRLPFEDGSLDACVACHVLHHLPKPLEFLDEARRALKPGGLLLIQELEASLLLRLLQRLVKNEGWSLAVDVFDRGARAIESDDPWEANTAIPRLLFSDPREFERRVPGFELILNEPCECLAFPLSGGVLCRVPAPALPSFVLRLVARLDRVLVRLAPGALALGRRVVLRKKP